jgi:hemerythrin-like domain-containing protein
MNKTSLILHDEHRFNLALLGQVEQALVRAPRGPSGHGGAVLDLMRTLLHQMSQAVARHFAFEERELFPRMQEAGEADIADMLREEHDAIRDVVEELRPLTQRAIEQALDDAGWDTLRAATLELVERQVSHIQKEEAMLLPLLDDLLDDATDAELAMAYASQ